MSGPKKKNLKGRVYAIKKLYEKLASELSYLQSNWLEMIIKKYIGKKIYIN